MVNVAVLHDFHCQVAEKELGELRRPLEELLRDQTGPANPEE
jgi:hypothetical protein